MRSRALLAVPALALHPALHACRLAGCSGNAAGMLLQDPGLVYSVQRGSSSLGPGAEFM